jgi:hypothetical protein
MRFFRRTQKIIDAINSDGEKTRALFTQMMGAMKEAIMAGTDQLEADIAGLKQSIADEITRAQTAIQTALTNQGVPQAAIDAADAEIVQLKSNIDAAFPAPAPAPSSTPAAS